MSSAEIKQILDAIGDLQEDVAVLQNKRLTIEEIGIGSFVGWAKAMVAIIFFMTTLGGSVYGILSQIDTVGDSLDGLNLQYSAHMKYLHKPLPSENNGPHT